MLIALGTAAAGVQAQEQAKLTPNLPDEPLAKQLSLAKAGAFLDNASLAWTQQRNPAPRGTHTQNLATATNRGNLQK